jgi:hypothetical protein
MNLARLGRTLRVPAKISDWNKLALFLNDGMKIPHAFVFQVSSHEHDLLLEVISENYKKITVQELDGDRT